uniref:Uncharacterized protein n=1 Tax=Elphidium margaritaceum TaxID=933848 RepID=A0A7S0TE76_9EUKA|mmetsp:Transcript_214/g.340  ORF Transcript_214/g.340 Transcript_214/m.340 type:complete len:204 (+) Transcript_214:30-641(+)
MARRSARLANKMKSMNEDTMWEEYEDAIRQEKEHHDALHSKNKNKQEKKEDDSVNSQLVERMMRDIDFLRNEFEIWEMKEYARFLVLKLKKRDFNHRHLSPSMKVDRIWHSHLLFPKQYFAFCKKYANGAILDHNPNAKNDTNRNERYSNTLLFYFQVFKQQPPQNVWEPIPVIERIAIAPIHVRKSAPASGGVKNARRFRPC